MSELSEEIRQMQEAARTFADKEVEPVAQALHLAEAEIPDDLLQKLCDLGIFGLTAPEEVGGLDMGNLAAAVVTEELSRAWFSVGALPARNWALIEILLRNGTAEQKQRFLPDLISGRKQAAHSGTEPEAGSDAANIKTTAVKDADHYILNGTKLWCTHARRAEVISCFVRTSKDHKHAGISLLLIEKPRGEFPGPEFTAQKLNTVGYHGMHSYQLFFDNLKVPVANLVGGVEGLAFRQLMATYEFARMQFAFRCIGLAQAAFDKARDYAATRVQFGKTINSFQAVRFKLADMSTGIEAARQLGYMVARKLDRGERADLEAGQLKLFAAEMAQKVCQEAVQIHGGMGFAVETAVNRYWRDSGLLTIGEGTSEIQREVIARRLVEERG
ncbi:alkylation response protein AidB-like acyl-CoA dehydrogenase [Pseudochelatococcus lubricantis]|uniref:Alkylation response protein AidB-like acyl-CoA dehydrogenase n=1 Tax=Pseudochelatococcus lubricantis TaxID=1538102 RepID=A0ABX0V1Q8_9HYPH|nr:acyl-CoA dehydrogenase family protein [Pseudochelatococcus lubricantis]NIJ59147.1 alkylation response protein AidB-like acyl-CoA dehydrogenase [Pseudochelatococcus lubricantis]